MITRILFIEENLKMKEGLLEKFNPSQNEIFEKENIFRIRNSYVDLTVITPEFLKGYLNGHGWKLGRFHQIWITTKVQKECIESLRSFANLPRVCIKNNLEEVKLS